MPVLEPLASDIFWVKGLLEPSVCQHVMDVAECAPFELAGLELGTTDSQIRNNDLLYLDRPEPLLQSTNQLLLGNVSVIQRLLFEHYGIRFPHAEACSILRYRQGQSYRRHVDNLLLGSRLEEAERGVPTRDVSVVGYLNDDFEGGETYFDRQDLTVRPLQGAALVFPSFFTFPHQALPVKRGQKYAFTTWLFH